MINQNQEMFMQWLAGAEGEEGEGDIPPGAQVVHLTQEEQDAVERVSAKRVSRRSFSSWWDWVLIVLSPSKRTWHATKMNSWLPTTYSK